MTEIQKIAATKGYWAAISAIESMLQAGLITLTEFLAHKRSIAHRA
jgi:hypothetical protein